MKLGGLYLVTPPYTGTEVFRATERALKSGVNILQYRDKEPSFRKKMERAKKFMYMCREYGIPFIVDDDPVLMDIVGADGIHIGKDDVPFDYVKSRYPEKIIGVSTYGSPEDAVKFQELGADYVAFGSFFSTKTKSNATMCDIGILDKLNNINIPVFVIGGINRGNVDEVLKYKISGIAVVSAIYSGTDIEGEVSYYLEKLREHGIIGK
ncbi:MAG: thiamine phosphate synthase [Ferroplasma sp.]|uniref:thiamine phosphate synthase n=1 Tax=Ferroplasma sp. TaxID=2591003 RepID=UPI002814BCFF|nr:thiamine phosphate synthase [Ferroplasma sp.]WMT52127.1 MAG: thiamine phosphate synthase [Ferroplasma sp.]